jgi:Flp pilus assembly protein TadD
MLMLGSLFIVRTDGEQVLYARRALGWLDRASDIEPSAMALSLKGAAYHRLGERDSAKEAYRRATELDSSYEEAFFNWGLIAADEEDAAEAERLLRRAIELNPRFLEAHGRLGILLRKLGRDTEAETQFRRCVEINPDDYFSKWYLSGVPGDPPLG